MGNRLIAVVDDDPLVRSATTSLLRSFGYDCCAFSSAEEFLQDEECDYACVVSDIQMSGMSGVELAHLLHKQAPPPPVILITAYPEARAAHAKSSGVVLDLLEKPLDGDALLGAVRAAIGDPDVEVDA
ncbi:response regulator transcription factor [Sphingomonas abietis]|uniref:Response regulator n=1 Tax=Sphingomonas abietis TaxID=3012344 RepID=A0ABY7NLE9_9SPHN|nr:response regulator [Sphingomonas abietis]WBO21800.1 response regulator [Sphingomonas abietis]